MAALVAGAVLAPGASANTLQADCSNFGTQLTAAGAGDTIVLTGLCTAPNATFTLPATPDLTIQGASSGTNGFDGTGVATPALTSAANPNDPHGLTVQNLIFENYSSSSAVNIASQNFGNGYAFLGDTFTHNSNPTGDGGGLHIDTFTFGSCALSGPTITVSGSTFSGNSAVGITFGPTGAEGGGGGGALIDLECQTGASPTITLTGNSFTGNTVPAGAGIFRGGGGFFFDIGHHVITLPTNINQSGNLFNGNSITGSGASYDGGGEATIGANITSVGDRFINNSLPGSASSTVSSEGGGLSTLNGGGCLTVAQAQTSQATNLVAAGNTIGAPSGSGTGGEGAGIYAGCTVGSGSYQLTLVNSTVSGNQATGTGAVAGAMGEATDILHLRNTILAGNPGGVDLGGFGASSGANVDADHSDVCAIGAATPFAGAGNICSPPALVNPNSGDVHETAASPTIDAGSNAFIPSTPTDVFGLPRIVSGKAGDPPIVDMGAAEFPPDNSFTLGKVKGKFLIVFVHAAGTVVVAQAGSSGREAGISKAGKLLKLSSKSGGPGKVAVRLRLTKKAKKALRRKGKLKIKSQVTFTPTGGSANSKRATLKLKAKKKKKH
jgi:hypothetical protein